MGEDMGARDMGRVTDGDMAEGNEGPDRVVPWFCVVHDRLATGRIGPVRRVWSHMWLHNHSKSVTRPIIFHRGGKCTR
jgi:hypothetical protein